MCTDIRFTWAIERFIITSPHPPTFILHLSIKSYWFETNQPEFMSSDTISDLAMQPRAAVPPVQGKFLQPLSRLSQYGLLFSGWRAISAVIFPNEH